MAELSTTEPWEHEVGQPTNGWATNFSWEDPANRSEVARMKGEIDFMSEVVNTAKEVEILLQKLQSVLAKVEASGYVWRANLPPFPLPGTLTPVRIDDVGLALPLAMEQLAFLTSPKDVTAYVEGQPVVINDVRPIDVFLRIAKGS